MKYGLFFFNENTFKKSQSIRCTTTYITSDFPMGIGLTHQWEGTLKGTCMTEVCPFFQVILIKCNAFFYKPSLAVRKDWFSLVWLHCFSIQLYIVCECSLLVQTCFFLLFSVFPDFVFWYCSFVFFWASSQSVTAWLSSYANLTDVFWIYCDFDKESQNILSWKQPRKIIESSS